jgi:hypothetical protein
MLQILFNITYGREGQDGGNVPPKVVRTSDGGHGLRTVHAVLIRYAVVEMSFGVVSIVAISYESKSDGCLARILLRIHNQHRGKARWAKRRTGSRSNH